jgi:hypothetical protein
VQRICTKENLIYWLWTTVFLFFVVPNLHTHSTHTVFHYINYPHFTLVILPPSIHEEPAEGLHFKCAPEVEVVLKTVFQVVTCSPCNRTKSLICYCTSCLGLNVISHNHLAFIAILQHSSIILCSHRDGLSRRISMPKLDHHLILYVTLPCKITCVLP